MSRDAEWVELTCVFAKYQEQISRSMPERLRHRKIEWGYRLAPGETISFHYPAKDATWIDGPSPDGCGQHFRLRAI